MCRVTAFKTWSPVKKVTSYDPFSIPQDKLTGEQLIWFMFQKTKYLYDKEEGRFQPLTFRTSEPCAFYYDCRGYTTDMTAEQAKQLYGKNKWVGLL